MAITACVAANGALHVFVRTKDGSVFYAWQAKGSTSWSGGKPGVAPAGLAPFAPAPK
jgi:hypothetical protein